VRRVLIAGGSGQIGSALISSAPSQYEIYAPDSDYLDITSSESVASAFAEFRPDVVVNAAAFTAVDKAETERELAFAVNAEGPGHLARACRLHRAPLIHLSTDYVFDGTKASAYREEDEPNPMNVYGESKLRGERQIVGAGIPYLILRVSWVFSSVGTNFVKTMLRLATRDLVRVVDDQFGTPCSADDIAEALWRCAARPDIREGERLLHYSSQPTTTWFGFANAIFESAASLGIVPSAPRLEPISTDQYPTAARRPSNSILDSSRFQALLGVPPPGWHASLRRVLLAIAEAQARHGVA